MRRVLLALAMLLLVGSIATPGPIRAQAQDAGAVFDAFDAAARAGDLDRAMSFIADTAVFTGISGRTYTGPQEIRGRYLDARDRGEYLVATPDSRQVAGNRVTWTELAFAPDLRDLGVVPLLVNAEAVVAGGRIVQLNYRPSAESAQRLRIASATQQVMADLQDAMAARDVPATMALFRDDAVAQTPGRTYTGRGQVQGWIESLFRDDFQEQLLSPRQVSGDRVIQHVDFTITPFDEVGVGWMRARVEATIPQGRISRLEVITDPLSQSRVVAGLNQSTVRYFLGQISAGNLGVINEVIAPSFVDRDVEPGMDPGIEGARQFFTMMREAFPDIQFTPVLIVADDDLVAVRMNVTGTNTGSMMGMPPTGARVSVSAIDILRLRDGMIVEHWGVADEASLLRQLGVMPSMQMP